MLKSVQWKLIVILLLLILVSMLFIGTYLVESLEAYYVDNFTESILLQSGVMAQLVGGVLKNESQVGYLDQLLSQFGGQLGTFAFVTDALGRVVATSPGAEVSVGSVWASANIQGALAGKESHSITIDPNSGERRFIVTMPAGKPPNLVGSLTVVASMEDVYRTIGDIKMLLAWATLLALGIAAVLGLLLSQTITKPILEVARGAAAMARGDFSRRLKVRSEDEIGKLAATFNYLSSRLSETLDEISREKSKVEAIVTHMTDGIIAVNLDGKISLVNPVAAEMLGLVPQDCLGTDVGKLIPNPEVSCAFTSVMRGEGLVQLQLEVPLASQKRTLRASFAPLRQDDKNAGIIGAVAVIHDITEQEKLDHMRREFVANVSHELRTPITTIKSYVETLLDGAISDPKVAQQFLDVTLSETNRMMKLIQDLLYLSQIEHKQARWEFERSDIEAILTLTVSRLKLLAEQKHQELSLEIKGELPEAIVDKDGIERVLQNVISNAIKFTPEGGTIKIVAEAVDGNITVRTIDSGIGIPESDLPHIFDRFYTVDKARSRELGGTGLGLAIAKEIVEAHGGVIEAKSRLGEGTEVSFTIPLVARNDDARH